MPNPETHIDTNTAFGADSSISSSPKEVPLSDNNSIVQEQHRTSKEEQICRNMAWYLLVVITLWLFCAIAASVITFCYTKSQASFALFTTLAPPAYILYWIVKRVFAEPENITKLRIKTKANRSTFRLSK